jgi:hypothetical protein
LATHFMLSLSKHEEAGSYWEASCPKLPV